MTREEKLQEAQRLLEEGKLEEARSLINEIKLDDKSEPEENKQAEMVESEDLEKENSQNDENHEKDLQEDIQEDKEEGKEEFAEADEKHEEALKEDKKQDEEDIQELQEDLEELQQKKQREKRSVEGDNEEMEKVILDGKEVAETKTEKRSFLEYLRSRDVSSRAFDTTGVKSADASAIIPEEIITKARMLPETVVDLRTKVTNQKISHAAGSYPILKPNKAILVSVEELKANPDLEKPQFDEVDYKVTTYRGQLAVAQEALDDSDDNLEGIIARHIQRQGLNTSNAKIAEVLRSATPVTATDLDALKDEINTGFDPAYSLELLVTQSFYNVIDKMKNNDGTYLLQPDVTAQSGKSLLGRPVTILADTLLGEAVGDKVAFLGDPKSFMVYFNRVETTARWVEEVYYGQVLAIAMRFDVKKVDDAAGKFITLNVTP